MTKTVLTGNYGPVKMSATRHIYLDATKPRKGLRWLPTLSLGTGLEKTGLALEERSRLFDHRSNSLAN